jgi:outer membrane protein assembly factor BamB
MRYALFACSCAAALAAMMPDDGDACPLLFRRRVVIPCEPTPLQAAVPIPTPPVEVKKPALALALTMFGGMPRRNMVNLTVKNLPAEWDIDTAKPVNIKWSAELGSKAFGSPVVAGGRVFIGTNNMHPRDPAWAKLEKFSGRPIDLGVLMCFRESDGKFLWQAVHEKLPGGIVVDWPYEGIGSTPTVEGDRLYYVSNRCELVCASVENGKTIWTLDMMGSLGVFPHNRSTCAPLVVDDYVFVVTSNGVDEGHANIPAPLAPSFLAVTKKTGRVVWQDDAPTQKFFTTPRGNMPRPDFFRMLVNRGDILSHGQWSNPAYAVVDGTPQVIFPGGDGWIYAFKPADGTLLWKFDCNPKDAKFEFSGRGNRSDFMGTPVIYKNRVYIGVGQEWEHLTGVGHFWCIDMTKRGDVSPELRDDASGKIMPNPKSAMVWHYGGVINDPEVVKKLRRHYYFGRTMSTSAIHEDLVYISDFGGVLHCLDASTGKMHWEFDTRSSIWGSPLYADGKVYLGTDAKVVYVFEHGKDAKNRKPIAENDMDGRIRNALTAHDGVLFVATENRLYAIARPK